MLKKYLSIVELFWVIVLFFTACSIDNQAVQNPQPSSCLSSESVNSASLLTTISSLESTTESVKDLKPTQGEKPEISISNTSSSQSDESSEAKELYEDLYIGEAYISGFAYIEPFQVDRTSYYDGCNFRNYPEKITINTLINDTFITADFDSESNVYVPSVEEDSKYYWQGFSEQEQTTLRYKFDAKIDEPIIGIAFFNHEVSGMDFSQNGKERNYSEIEYSKAIEEVEKCNQDRKDLGGTLREMTIEDTIVGAKQICSIRIKGTDMKILLSKYFSIGFESTADVYVADFINSKGEITSTFEKYNCSAY